MSGKNIILVLILAIAFGVGGYLIGTGRLAGNQQQSEQPADYFAQSSGTDYQKVVVKLKEQLKGTPEDWAIYARLGDVYFRLRRFEDAIKYYKKAIELNPDDVDTYNDLGLSNHYMGKSVEGLKYIEEGIKRDPYYHRIWLTKGFILAYGLGKKEEAEKAWQKALKLDPEGQVGKAAKAYLEEFSKK